MGKTPEQKAAFAAKQREQRAQWKAEGRCQQAGCESGGAAYCPKHLAAANARTAKHRAKKAASGDNTSTYSRRRAVGLCGSCGLRPAPTGMCDVCREEARLAKQAQRDAHVAAEGCSECGRPPVPGYKLCAECQESGRDRQKTLREHRHEQGLCPTCGKPAMPGKTVCEECSGNTSAKSSARYYDNKAAGVCRSCSAETGGAARCPKCNAYQKEIKQKTYKERRAAGLCCFCPIPPPPAIPGKSYCEACREKSNARDKRRRTKLRNEVFAAYGGPVCAGCNESDADILEVNHIHGGGTKQLREIGQGQLYRWIKKNNFPLLFNVLCPTCNKKAHKGIPLPNELKQTV